jgi:hypothetical protein
MTGPLVDLPHYPTNLPQYNNPYVLPEPTFQSPTYGEQGANSATDQSAQMIRALLDPSSKLTKNLSSAQSSLMRGTFLSNLRDMVSANRRERLLGRRGFIDPEKMDSGALGQTMRNAWESQLGGQVAAQGLLQDLAGQMRSTASQYVSDASLENKRRDSYREDLVNRMNQLREDYINQINQQRTDALGPYDQQRNDILNAINLYRGNQAQGQSSRTSYLAQKYGEQAVNSASTDNLLKSIQALFTNQQASPWINPDLVQ